MSNPNTTEDLLSFKEYDPVHENYSRGGGRAEININSPKRDFPTRFDNDLMDDLSTSIQMDEERASGGRMQQQQQHHQAPSGDSDDNADKPTNFSFFTIEYYQQFFNVDTPLVMERIFTSMIPRRAPATYLKQNIGRNPDLYGPVWIVITLIFCIAISGNISSYLQHASPNYHWRYNFHLVSIAATTIILYVCFVPLGLWAAFKWFAQPSDPDVEIESPYTPSLLTLICVYGYSLVIYIPVSILWVIQISVLQWLLVVSATFLSGSVLVLVLTPALRVSRGSIFFAAGIVAAHFLLAAGFMLYFFHVPEAPALPETVTTVAVEAVKQMVTAAAAPIAAKTGA